MDSAVGNQSGQDYTYKQLVTACEIGGTVTSHSSYGESDSANQNSNKP